MIFQSLFLQKKMKDIYIIFISFFFLQKENNNMKFTISTYGNGMINEYPESIQISKLPFLLNWIHLGPIKYTQLPHIIDKIDHDPESPIYFFPNTIKLYMKGVVELSIKKMIIYRKNNIWYLKKNNSKHEYHSNHLLGVWKY